MAVTYDIEAHERRFAYDNTLKLALQQTSSRIWDYCEEHDVQAEDGLAFDEMLAFGDPLMQPKTANKWNPVQISELSFVRRWLTTYPWYDYKHWQSFDATKTLTNPASAVLQSFRNSYNRKKDAIAYAAMFGVAKRGVKQPGDDDDAVFDTANQVVAVNVVNSGSATNTGLNRAKLNAAYAKLIKNEVIGDDGAGEEVHVAIQYRDLEALLLDEKVTDRMFLLGQFRETGQLSYLNMMFHHYQSLATDGNGYYRVPVWVRSGVRRGVTKDLMTGLVRREDIVGSPWQAGAWAELGACRTDEKKVVEIKCYYAA